MIAISKYNKQHPLRVFEAFAGYGSQSLAFKYLKDKHPGFDFKVVGYSEIEQQTRVYSTKGISPTLNSAMGHGGNCIPLLLIVKEISKSKLYALAGNSIVTNCLTAMFEELIFPSGNNYHDKTGQLSLF